MLSRSHPKVADMLDDAKDDLLAFTGFPAKHWRQIWSTNPLERVNKEIKRRTDVVGVFPNPAALLRLAGARPGRAARRMGRRRPPLLLRTLHDRARSHERTPPRRWTHARNSPRHNQSTDPHGVEKLHHSAGRHPVRARAHPGSGLDR